VLKLDNHTLIQRKNNMKHIHSSNTRIEILLRSRLWEMGLRYRKNYRHLPGKPDIVFLREKIAVFCDSEFWHGANYSIDTFKNTANRLYWINKIEKNIEHDKIVNLKLKNEGYIVLRFWGRDIEKNINTCIKTIEENIQLRSK